jgi:hypothetical protein
MIVNDLDVFRAVPGPDEANAELIVYADAVLSGTFPFQSFQPISRRHTQIVKSSCPIQHSQLSHGNSFEINETPHTLACKQPQCISALERPDRHR